MIGDPNDNRDWPGAQRIPFGPYNAAGRATGTASGKIAEAGEARWYRFDVDPGQDVDVTLSGLTNDYDLALYGDIETAFDELVTEERRLPARVGCVRGGARGAVPGAQHDSVPTQIPTVANPPTTSQQYAPRVYAPRVYAPRVHAPRVHAPRVYAPRVYAPRVYAPGSYIPANITETSFSDAFSGAQNQTLVALSANIGSNTEAVGDAGNVKLRVDNAGNPVSGSFYIRVQGHTDQAFGDTPFQRCRQTGRRRVCGDDGPARRPRHGAPAHRRAVERRDPDRHRHQQPPARRARRPRRLPRLVERPGQPDGRCRDRRGRVEAGPGPLDPGRANARLSLRRQPRRRGDQGDRRRLPATPNTQVRRPRRRRRRDPVLPLPRRLRTRRGGASPSRPSRTNSPVRRQPQAGPGPEPGRVRLRHDRDDRWEHRCRCPTSRSDAW